MLLIKRNSYDEMLRHGKESYPKEGCGFLIGKKMENGSFVVEEIRRARNINTERTRYEIAHQDFYQMDKEVKGTKMEIIGFYHSHPNKAPIPSSFDLKMAWMEYYYIIIGVKRNKIKTRVWKLNKDGKSFDEKSFSLI